MACGGSLGRVISSIGRAIDEDSTASASLPRTRAERTNFTETSTHADVLQFLDSLQKSQLPVSVGILGRTTEGREIPYAIASRPLVRTPEEGASHARALGPHWMLLLRRHGASLAGKSVRECVFRSIYTTRNAELQLRAMAIGTLGPLSPGEAEKCGAHNLGSRGVDPFPGQARAAFDLIPPSFGCIEAKPDAQQRQGFIQHEIRRYEAAA